MNQDQQTALDIHNQARSEVNSPPLIWSWELAEEAQTWADYVAGNDIGEARSRLRMRGGDIYESIATIKLATPRDPLSSMASQWHAEKRLWHGQEILSYCQNRCLHGAYTQMIWSKTTHLGMGAASNASSTFVVARYWPAGNVVGERPLEGVEKPGSETEESAAKESPRVLRHPFA